MKIGIIGAMEKEAAFIQDKMQKTKEETIAGMHFVLGKIGRNEIVCVQSGVGKVNAGVCASILMDHFKIEALMNTGIAGSLNNDLNIGDVLLSKEALYHDVDATVFGYQKGEVPGLKTQVFYADENLIKMVKECIETIIPEIHCMVGRIASGDQFVCEAKIKEQIKESFHADACEMEGAAIAQTAYLYQIPFVILRFISDKADGSDIKDYMEFEKEAAEHSAKILMEILEKI